MTIVENNSKNETLNPIILVVDDNQINVKLLVSVLKKYNFDTLVSFSGEDCLKQARENNPDIILLDVVMPGMDGFETCKRLKENTETKDIPVIFMTALSEIEDKITGFQLGAVDYVIKPIKIDEVLARIKVHTKLRELNKKLEKKNILLEEEIQQRIRAEAKLQKTLEQLQVAQKEIIAKERLAYLSNLTSGIAHELCNPLNFVQNFAQLSSELLDEFIEELNLETNNIEAERFDEFTEIINELKHNADGIYQHGKRAERIIKMMVKHAKLHNNQLRSSQLNQILQESLQIASDTLWKKQNFSIKINTNYDQSIGEVIVSHSDIVQAFINILDNSYYALKFKSEKQESNNQDFMPTISVKTANLGKKVEIKIYDNGIGIDAKVRDKIFNPFLTTKPPGEGIGLGLSLTYQIIVGQHHGSIKIETELGEYTEFIIEIPVRE
ncbi:response regulator [Okeania sp.]|uniref:hybrid sensor histidine kinase/response regulator n=1 Tax=Okeania sp. TaxID=3100323 RepID=UPI002B4B7100|nr:response regulator [Okeania sp.]MEB3342161.1 response regulator [Okeania sp.]